MSIERSLYIWQLCPFLTAGECIEDKCYVSSVVVGVSCICVTFGWVSLNNMSKKLFEFDSNIFFRFKDHFFKVLATDVMANGFPLMFNCDEESRFLFY